MTKAAKPEPLLSALHRVDLRRRLQLDQVACPLVIVEERDGGLFLQPAVATPIRDIPQATIRQWLLNDEADAKDLKAFRKKK